jgi:hypothetical protein
VTVWLLLSALANTVEELQDARAELGRRESGEIELQKELQCPSAQFAGGYGFAAAQQAELQHRQHHGDEKSPLAGLQYGPDDHDLGRLAESGIDEPIEAWCDTFAMMTRENRQGLRDSLTADDIYTRISFARRAAVRALRGADHSIAQRGLFALAIIDATRVDFRDVIWTTAIVRYALGRVSPSTADSCVETAAAAADANTAGLLQRFVGVEPKDLRENWLMVEVGTGESIGLVKCGSGPYGPTVNLLATTEAATSVVGRDQYLAGALEVGAKVPVSWLRGSSTNDLQAILARASAITSFSGKIHGEQLTGSSTPFDQLFRAFVVEMSTPDDAATFGRLWPDGPERKFASLVVIENELLVVLIARSSVVDVPSIESDDSLRRFEGPLRGVLLAALKDGPAI